MASTTTTNAPTERSTCDRPTSQVTPLRPQPDAAVQRRDRLGGLIHEYTWAA